MKKYEYVRLVVGDITNDGGKGSILPSFVVGDNTNDGGKFFPLKYCCSKEVKLIWAEGHGISKLTNFVVGENTNDGENGTNLEAIFSRNKHISKNYLALTL